MKRQPDWLPFLFQFWPLGKEVGADSYIVYNPQMYLL